MIPREVLKKVRYVEISTRGLVNDVFGGEYHSVFKGRGMSFAEVREYQYVRNVYVSFARVYTAYCQQIIDNVTDYVRAISPHDIEKISQGGGGIKKLKIT